MPNSYCHLSDLERALNHQPRAQALWLARPHSGDFISQAALQGTFIVAKVQGHSDTAAQYIGHLRRYVSGLLTPTHPIDPNQGATHG